MNRKTLFTLAMFALLAGCSRPSDVASANLSQAADNFEVNRRIVFYNGITGAYILTIEGLCSKGNDDTEKKISITCKVGPGSYKKHYLGVSDNVTYFIEQIDPAPASTYRYRVTFNPSALVPDIRTQGTQP